MRGKGLIHIYEGEGKGKTTAAVGLAVRFAGTGGKVLFAQFLKKNNSGELKSLQEIRDVELMLCSRHFGFTFQMTPEEKQEAAAWRRRVSASISYCFSLYCSRSRVSADSRTIPFCFAKISVRAWAMPSPSKIPWT